MAMYVYNDKHEKFDIENSLTITKAEWYDGNPNNEDRTGLFVCAYGEDNKVRIAGRDNYVSGVTVKNDTFLGSDKDNRKYCVVQSLGVCVVKDDGTLQAGQRCMPSISPFGYAEFSSSYTESNGYLVIGRVDKNHIKIVFTPNNDEVKRLNDDLINKGREIDKIRSRISTLTSSFNFKGYIESLNDLPNEPEQNDTYYVNDLAYNVSWTGSEWVQSSASQDDIQDRLSTLENISVNHTSLIYQNENDIEKNTSNLNEIIYQQLFATLELWNNAEVGKTISSKGVVSDSSNGILSNYIAVNPSTTYSKGGSSTGAFNICFYDNDYRFISGISQFGSDNFVTPENAKYMRLYNFYKNDVYKKLFIAEGSVVPTYSIPRYDLRVKGVFYEIKDFEIIGDVCVVTNPSYPVGDVRRYGYDKSSGNVVKNTEAIQTALNCCKVVTIPRDDKGLDTDDYIKITHKLKFTKSGQSLRCGSKSHQLNLRNSTTPLFVDDCLIEIPNGLNSCSIENITIRATNSMFDTNATMNGINIGAYDDVATAVTGGNHILNNVEVVNIPNIGVKGFYKTWSVICDGLRVRSCGKGIEWHCTDSFLTNVYVYSCKTNGVEIHRGSNSLSGKIFCNGTIGNTEYVGLLVTGYHNRFPDLSVQQNRGGGIKVTSGTLNGSCNIFGTVVVDGNGWENPPDKWENPENTTIAVDVQTNHNIFSSLVINPHFVGGCVEYGLNVTGEKNNITVNIAEVLADWESSGIYEDFAEFKNIKEIADNNRVILNCQEV